MEFLVGTSKSRRRTLDSTQYRPAFRTPGIFGLRPLAGYDMPQTLIGKPPFLLRPDGPDRREYELGWYTTTIGSGADSDVIIDGPGVSRHHATITRRRFNRFFLEDVGSDQGTSVNGHRITRWKRIRGSDMLAFGHVHVVFMDTTPVARQPLSLDPVMNAIGWAMVAVLLILLTLGWCLK